MYFTDLNNMRTRRLFFIFEALYMVLVIAYFSLLITFVIWQEESVTYLTWYLRQTRHAPNKTAINT